ncbi:MAG: M14 family zinc carboxypeptidase [Nocardioidaceae bacterium]
MTRLRISLRPTLIPALALLLVGAVLVALGPARVSASPRRPAVIGVERIGASVVGRPIYAYHVGDPKARLTVVLMATMHGDEPAPRRILLSLRDGAPVTGVNLWLIPTVNPDGLARRTRRNAHHVDLNRNFPWRWKRLYGNYNSGRSPASEPETRALIGFFKQVHPRYVVSFHQPLHGVDTSTRKSRHFARRLAAALNLPRKRLVCGGVCHGTFTEWFNHKYAGVAITVEYGSHPSRHRMRVAAPRQLLRLFGGHR